MKQLNLIGNNRINESQIEISINEVEASRIVHCHLLMPNWEVLLFMRQDGYWCSPGGGIELFESNEGASIREVWEETKIVLPQDRVFTTKHCFTGRSPKGRRIYGTSCLAFLPVSFHLDDIKFNGELVDYKVLSFGQGLDFLSQNGLPEGRGSLAAIL
jgi:8-oxo-dGTP pyrophosphatase MutT (NUDIX family)